MKKNIYLIIILLFFVPTSISAQQYELSDEQQEEIKEQAMRQVEKYENCLKYLASKKTNEKVKDVYYRRALDLFMGRGDEYYNYSTKKIEPACTTQVSSVKRTTPLPLKTKEYLKRVRKYTYTDVSMEEAELVYVDNLERDENNDSIYHGVVHFAMEFVGYRENIPVYRDITWKDMEIIVIRRETGTGVLFDVKLGDSQVTATENASNKQ